MTLSFARPPSREDLLAYRDALPQETTATPPIIPAMLVPAVTQLGKLQTEFEWAAVDARTPKFFRSWFEDHQARAQEYDRYADKADAIADLIAKNDTPAARTELAALKDAFETRARTCNEAARGLFKSWLGSGKNEGPRFAAYAGRVSAVLKQL